MSSKLNEEADSPPEEEANPQEDLLITQEELKELNQPTTLEGQPPMK
jgi:hypothetical protein